jgi:two-component system LytT family response regulator
MLRASRDFELVGECANGYEAVEAVRGFRPDLMLLDVQMPELDGFGVLERIEPEQMPEVVFVTAYDQYALKAFEVQALDYLLKPFDEDRLLNTLNRARLRLEQQGGRPRQDIAALLERVKPPKDYVERFVVRLSGRILLLAVEDVDWIEAEDKYVRLHAKGTSYLMRDTIARLQSSLNPRRFIRVHRSAIVKVDSVKEILPDFHGDHEIVLLTGERLRLSRTYRDSFFASIEKNV